MDLTRSLPLALCLSAVACGTSPPQMMTPVSDGANTNPLCSPIAASGSLSDASCFLPYPSSFYLKTDASTATGFRVNFPKGVLPKTSAGKEFDPTRLNLLDGFSPASQIIVDLGSHVDGSAFIGVNGDPTPSTTAAYPVQLLRYDTGERVPIFVEVDANVASSSSQPQALIIRPLVRLNPGTRYVVALRDLKDTGGKIMTNQPFRILAGGKVASGSRLADIKSHYDEIFAVLDKAAVPRESLTLAWDFVTGSDKRIQGNLLHMRDVALARWDAQKLGLTVTSADLPKDVPLLLRRIVGTYDVPSFLVNPDLPSSSMMLDAAGMPADTGTNYKANFLILVPACAATARGPLRVVVYGHGLLGAADEIQSSQHRNIANQLCTIEMATDFIGLADRDVAYLGSNILTQFDQLSITADRLQQAQINFAVLARLARTKLKDLPELTLEGKAGGTPLMDGTQVYYLGGSQGGIFGNTIVAISPDLSQGVLNVGGGIYSMMLPRSSDFNQFQHILSAAYDDLLTQQVLLSISQMYWDYSDPISFARNNMPGLTLPGLDGKPMPAKQILLQESHNDCQVPNVATRTVARTMGLPQLKPAVETVFGLSQADGPVASAYVQYDTQLAPAPSPTNVQTGVDNGAHGSLGRIPAVIQQLDEFLKPGGMVRNTCAGSCVFPLK